MGAELPHKKRYAPKAQVLRAAKLAEEIGIKIGGIELGADGTIRILKESVAPALSPYDKWKAENEGG